MLEIEMKFAVNEFAAIETQMRAWHAVAHAAILEADHYFNAPDRDFARTDEAFRLRCVGAENRITYKGPKQPGPTKTRTEIEIRIESGAEAVAQYGQLMQHLGYRPTATVRKRRTCYDFQKAGFDLQACCDEVDTLGCFIEIEIVTESAQRDAAQAILLEVVAALNLPTSEPRSYLEMVLAKQKT
jgi:adenylate cyclase class 2